MPPNPTIARQRATEQQLPPQRVVFFSHEGLKADETSTQSNVRTENIAGYTRTRATSSTGLATGKPPGGYDARATEGLPRASTLMP